MFGIIDNFDFYNCDVQKYWSFPSTYSVEKKKEMLSSLLYSDEYVASEKRDGYLQLVIKDEDGNITMRARSKGVNGWVCKQNWVPHLKYFFDALPKGTCLVCEVYIPNGTSKKITTLLGCLKDKAIQRQKDNGWLRLSVFDVLAYDNKCVHHLPIVERIKYLNKIQSIKGNYVDIVTYWDNPNDIHSNWLDILAHGGEGVVLTRKDNPYEFGKRTARHTLKLKKELDETIDVFLTGRWKVPTKLYTGKDIENWEYWYDELKEERVRGFLSERIDNQSLIPVTRLWFYNWAAAIEVATFINGEETPIGWISNITDEIRESIASNPDAWRGSVIELQAMEIDSTGKVPTLRHAKIVGWRNDKNMNDCEWKG